MPPQLHLLLCTTTSSLVSRSRRKLPDRVTVRRSATTCAVFLRPSPASVPLPTSNTHWCRSLPPSHAAPFFPTSVLHCSLAKLGATPCLHPMRPLVVRLSAMGMEDEEERKLFCSLFLCHSRKLSTLLFFSSFDGSNDMKYLNW